MNQHMRKIETTRVAKAIAMSRAANMPAALTTLILSVLIVLLSGAVWMHAI